MSSNTQDTNSQPHKRDPDLAGAEVALQRAARKAREIAWKNGAAVVIEVNGKIKEEYQP